LADLGLTTRLLTNNPKKIHGLEMRVRLLSSMARLPDEDRASSGYCQRFLDMVQLLLDDDQAS
jgi:hypothetical protein